MKPSVSVIIPTRNRAPLLAQALDSVFAQEGIGTLYDMDVVVVDDASTDATPDVVARYPSVRHIRLSTNRGVGRARNVGIAESTGTFVAFLDDDDLWLPRKLTLQVAALEADPETGVAYSQLILASQGGEYLFPELHAPSGSLFSRLLFVNLCVVPAVLVRREALNRVGGFTTELLEDYEMWLRLARYFPFVFVPGVVAVYRISPAGRLQTGIRNGLYGESLHRIVENALAALPYTEASERVRSAVRATVELRVAVALVELQRTALAWQHLRAGLEIDARTILDPRNWASVAGLVGRHAATFASPVTTAGRLLGEIRGSFGKFGILDQVRMNALRADAYWEIAAAQDRGISCHASVGRAAHAVARSILANPLDLRKWGALARFVGRRFHRRSPHNHGSFPS